MNRPESDSKTVGLITVATGRYIEFVDALIASAEVHLHNFSRAFVLTDSARTSSTKVQYLPWPKMEWPLPTLLRYRGFCQYAAILEQVDVLLYTDADMLFVGSVDVTASEGLVAVQHPGYVNHRPTDLPYERDPRSMARVASNKGTRYFCGGVQGGASAKYLQAAAAIDAAIQLDQVWGVTAVWHDESHWNRYCADHSPELVLDSRFCTPDVARDEHTRIVALTKDHVKYRELSRTQAMRHLLMRGRLSLRYRAERLRRLLN